MTQAGALATLTEVRAHFIVYGTVRRRQIGGSAAHLLALDGIVRHTEISPDVQREISADFRRALPSKVQFSVDNDAFAFEVTSEWADVAARYIIGLAALASGDPWYAEKLLLGVEQRLRTSARAGPLQTIAQKLPSRFEELYGRWVEALGRAYAITRRIEFAAASEEVAKKLLNRNPNNYGALLQVAICEFVLRRDVAAAKAAILQCRRVRDSTWRYSLAFLLAYEGKTRRAREEYEEAFKGRLQDVTVPVQAEEFMHLVIEEEPDKAHLYFFTGLINYRVKEDLASARRDFEAFLAQTLPEEHADERRLAQRYLEELQTAPIGSPVA
jgi:tetratricopeptide (TPR) repeat protein